MPAELHLSADLDDKRRRPSPGTRRETFAVPRRHWTRSIRLAERGGLDFVTLGGRELSLAQSGSGHSDVPAALAKAAAATRSIGLFSAVPEPPGEPVTPLPASSTRFRAHHRTGWLLEGLLPEEEDTDEESEEYAFPDDTEADGDDEEGVPAATDLTAVRNAAANDFIERDRLRRLALRSVAAGLRAAGNGPSPQPVPPVAVVLDAHGPDRRWELAAQHADVVLLDAEHPAAARVSRMLLLRQVADEGRDPAGVRVLLRLGVDFCGSRSTRSPAPVDSLQFTGAPGELADQLADWHTAGVADGFHLVPAHVAADLPGIVHGLVPRLHDLGAFRPRYQDACLRSRLGLAEDPDPALATPHTPPA